MYNHKKNIDSNILIKQVEVFCQDSQLEISLLANLTAVIKQYLPETNWVGFYLAKQETLYLGPFQGESACTLIPFSRGVCGKVALTRKPIIVNDVHQFPGHIACDSNSQSEIVIPIIVNDKIYGVLDIDSPVKNYFTKENEIVLLQVIDILQRFVTEDFI